MDQNDTVYAPLEDAEAADSKIQLILTGEKLFAERGFEGASLREIASAAGHGNNNAVRYHFGSKQGLIQAIFRFRVIQMEPIRARLLAKLEKDGLLGDARSLLEVILLPYLTLRAPDGTISYPAFLMQYLLHDRPKGVEHVADEAGALSAALNRALALIEARIFFLDKTTADRRLLSASTIFISAVISAENRIPQLSANDYRAVINDTMDQCATVLTLSPQRTRSCLMTDPEIQAGLKS
ncbi:MAG: TetR/AcrR family transcriptional regulator [Novosphingobium sp.]|uniref:TetR/AcrR family transcriptional regulator n=1 Tax=Novosphingobium sp. TaxID=1874826 RepID=UPI003B9C28D7